MVGFWLNLCFPSICSMYSQYVWLESSFLSICNYDPNYLGKKKKEELNYVFWGKNTKLEKKKSIKINSSYIPGLCYNEDYFSPFFQCFCMLQCINFTI